MLRLACDCITSQFSFSSPSSSLGCCNFNIMYIKYRSRSIKKKRYKKNHNEMCLLNSHTFRRLTAAVFFFFFSRSPLSIPFVEFHSVIILCNSLGGVVVLLHSSSFSMSSDSMAVNAFRACRLCLSTGIHET